MSTEHNGGYCTFKDKMILSRQEAKSLAGRLGQEHYKCEECEGWHVTHRMGSRRKKMISASSQYKATGRRPNWWKTEHIEVPKRNNEDGA